MIAIGQKIAYSREEKRAFAISIVLGVLALLYFINGLTQGITRIPVNQSVEQASGEAGNGFEIAWTSGKLAISGLSGLHRLTSENTGLAIAIFSISIALSGLGVAWRRGRLGDASGERWAYATTAVAVTILAILPWTVVRWLDTAAAESSSASLQVLEIGTRNNIAIFSAVAVLAICILAGKVRVTRLRPDSS